MKANQDIKSYITKGFLIVFVMVLVIYGLFTTRFLWKHEGISVSFDKPVSGNVSITGTAKKAAHVLINGRNISIAKSGLFTDTVMLLPGYNTILISAEDQFGHIDIEKETFYYQPNELSLAQR